MSRASRRLILSRGRKREDGRGEGERGGLTTAWLFPEVLKKGKRRSGPRARRLHFLSMRDSTEEERGERSGKRNRGGSKDAVTRHSSKCSKREGKKKKKGEGRSRPSSSVVSMGRKKRDRDTDEYHRDALCVRERRKKDPPIGFHFFSMEGRRGEEKRKRLNVLKIKKKEISAMVVPS